MMKKNYFLLILLIYGLRLFPQGEISQAYLESINSIFSGIPAEKITTGVLAERAIASVDLSKYDGSASSPNCDIETWKKIVHQMYLANVDISKCPYNLAFLSKIEEAEENKHITMASIFYDYNYIPEEAVASRKIVLDTDNNIIKDLSGSGNPLGVKSCVATAAIEANITPGIHEMSLEQDFFVTNKERSDISIFVDLHDGDGFIPFEIGGTMAVQCFDPGEKIITFKFLIEDREYYSNCKLNIVDEFQVSGLKSGIEDALKPDFGPTAFTREGIDAEYGIFYRCGGSKTIRKPYIIVSGYDPMDKNRIEDEIKEVLISFQPTKVIDDEKNNLYRIANKNGFLDKLRDNGYDVIIYRSKESTESIISNAKNLIEFIKKINSEKVSDNELIIVGASMGGLIVRYALTYMEHKGIDHQTKLFLSLDTPQKGANIPLGIQFMFKYLDKDLNGLISISEDIKHAKETSLDCDAAQQMLLYHHSNTSNNKAACSPQRHDFLNSLKAIGSYPKQCRNIAISMGSGNGTGQGFSPGELVLEKKPGNIVTDLLLPSAPKIKWEFKVYSVPNKRNHVIYSEKLFTEVCVPNPIMPWKTSCVSQSLASRSVSVDNTLPLDNAPGSIKNLHNTEEFIGDSELFGTKLNTLLNLFGVIYSQKSPDCFIPAYSALGLNQVMPHQNIKSYFNSNNDILKVNDNLYYNMGREDLSFFDVMYIENKNDAHIFDENKIGVFSDDMLAFMSDEVSPSTKYLENKSIVSGKAVAHDARNYIVAGENVDGYTYNNGNIVVKDNGSMELTAGKSVKLKHGVKVERGGKLHVKISNSNYCDKGTTHTPILKKIGSENPALIEQQTQKEDMFDLVEEYSKPVIVYPNPAKDYIFISSNKEGNNLVLSDLEGTVIEKMTFEKKVRLDLSDYNTGVYYVKVIQENGKTVTEEIIINK